MLIINVHTHFRPYHSKCLYCEVDYDVIGKLEDYNEDVMYIAVKQNITEHLQRLNVIQNKSPRTHASQRDRIKKYMSQLSPKMIHQLKKLYKIDFEMFDYT